MEDWLLGYCHQFPDGNRPGRIEILASLRLDIHGKYVVDRPAHELQDDVGPSGFAFWPQNPPVPHDLCGSLIRFRTNRSNDHGNLTTTRDWLRVCRSATGWDVHRIGHLVVEQGPDLKWQQEPRWVKGIPKGEHVFVRQVIARKFIGPWRIGREIPDIASARELIPHPNPSKVLKFAENDLPPDCIYSKRLNNGSVVNALLYVPDEAQGQFVDLATPKQLAKWLVDRIVAAAPQVAIRIKQEIPNWTTILRSGLEGNNECEREFHRSRWQRIEAALDDLILDAESLDKLLQQEKVKAIVANLFETKIEEKVTARVSEIEAEAQQKAKNTVERLGRETQEVEQQYRKAQRQYDGVVKETQIRLDAAEERERAVRELECHIQESRERLLKDLALYQSLLPGIVPQSTPCNSAPLSTESETEPVPTITPVGPPITVESTFIDSRLWPSLARWYRGIPRILAVILHAAVCGSKASIVPSPAWARAYADALGTFSRLVVVNVEPTWLGFEDLWRGGLGVCWERASRDESQIDLVLLRDFNRALPQCYARPLLDIIAGYCDTLPERTSCRWPKTLRLLACPAPPDESLPLTVEVVRHFAAVQRAPAVVVNERPEPLVQGHVTADTWSLWARAAAPADPDEKLVNEFGPLACAAATDAAAIAQVLRVHGMNERSAKQTAHEIRLSAPAEYLAQQ
jgi:hypothetical protein